MKLLISSLASLSACATSLTPTSPPQTAANTPSQTTATPMSEQEGRRFRAMQAEVRARYHAAFDESRALLVDLVSDRPWCSVRLDWILIPNNEDSVVNLTQLNGSCELHCDLRIACSIVVPRGYNIAYLSAHPSNREDPALMASVQFRTRIAGQEPRTEQPILSEGGYYLREIRMSN